MKVIKELQIVPQGVRYSYRIYGEQGNILEFGGRCEDELPQMRELFTEVTGKDGSELEGYLNKSIVITDYQPLDFSYPAQI